MIENYLRWSREQELRTWDEAERTEKIKSKIKLLKPDEAERNERTRV